MTFLICAAIQIIILIVVFVDWRNDCKKFGKDKLAVSLKIDSWHGLLFARSGLCRFFADKPKWNSSGENKTSQGKERMRNE